MRVTVVLSAGLLIGTSIAQQPATDPSVIFQSQTREVLLEVIVRDAHGKLVTKIDPAQVSVYEDGVRQEIKSFRLVPGREVRAGIEKEKEMEAAKPGALRVEAPAARFPSNPLRTVNIVCLVLNDLTTETRAFALDAARKFVDKQLRPDTFIGVFTLDQTGLRPAFPFSNNREQLIRAIELASVNQLPKLAEGSAALLNGLSMSTLGAPLGGVTTATVGPAGTTVITGPTPGVPAAVDGASDADPLGSRGDMEYATNRGLFELDALVRLVKQLSQLPFQKTVLLMSTGLTRPPDQIEYWNSLIKLANKGGVTFYGLDVFGLGVCQDQPDCARGSMTAPPAAGALVSTPSSASVGMTQGVAAMSAGQSTVGLTARGPNAPGGSSTAGPSPAEQLMQSMKQTDFLRYAVLSANTQEALREISESTGGFVIANTNNTEALLAKVMEDVDTHFELAYRPASPGADGHFRKIEVKLAKTDLRVQTRTGYYAVPETGQGPLTAGDFGALQALDAKPRPHDFDFGSNAYRFKSGKGTAQYAIAFEVPIAGLTATPEVSAKRHRYHAYLLAVVKNAQGEIVERVSKDVPSEIEDKYLTALHSEVMNYTHGVSLSPGHYTIETAVVDQEGNRASTHIQEIDNREQAGLGVSDLALVRRVHALERPPDPLDPFEIPGKRAQPFVSTALAAGTQPYIYFVVYPEQANSEVLSMRAQFVKDGRVLATQKSELPLPDPSGSIPMAIQAVAFPGDYEVRVTVGQGRRSVQRTVKYAIAAK
jgi:VWFA-related protein